MTKSMPSEPQASKGPGRDAHSLAAVASIARFHIVAIGALGTLTFAWVFYGRYAPALALLSGLDWFLVNLLNRVVDIPEDEKNEIAGTPFVARHKQAIVRLGFSVLAASFAVHALYYPWLAIPRAAYHLLGFGYNWPLPGGRRRIKQLYFWKNTASATGFVLTCIVGPIVALGLDGTQSFASDVSPATVIAATVFFFPFELSYEVLYDLRDVEGDRSEDVRTYPVVHGVRVAARVVDALLAFSALSLVVSYVAGWAPWRLAVMAAAPVLQLAYVKRVRASREISSLDCIRLTWMGALLLAAYHAWNALGLPGAR